MGDGASRQLRTYRAASRVVAAMPAPLAVAMADAGGMVWFALDGTRRRLVAQHQQRIDPTLTTWQLRRATAASFRSYGRYWAHALALPHRSHEAVQQGIRVEGREHVDAALAAGKGVIFAMPHVGYWDHGGAWVGFHWKQTVTAEALEPADLFRWFCEMRARHGMHVEPPGPAAMVALGAALRRNEAVGLLCERDIVGNGELLEFFGHPARVPLGPAVLSLRSGAPLLPNAVFADGGLRAHGKILPPLMPVRSGSGLRADAVALTNRLLRCFEELIREHPEQWHVFQPFWEDEKAPTATLAEVPSPSTPAARSQAVGRD